MDPEESNGFSTNNNKIANLEKIKRKFHNSFMIIS